MNKSYTTGSSVQQGGNVRAHLFIFMVFFSCMASAEEQTYEIVISDEQLEEIRKLHQDAIDKRKLKIENRHEVREAFEAAEKINTVEAYELFQATYPYSPYEKTVSVKIEQAEYDHAVKQHNVEALDVFIWKYPQSDHLQSARYKRARILDSVDEYNAYIEAYPHHESALYYRDRAALKAAKRLGTKEAFRNFIELYPQSDWIEQAKYYYTYGYHSDD